MSKPPLSWQRDGRDWPNRSASVFHRAGGVAWHVQRMGRGPVLLLLHGVGGATHSWRGLMPSLAKNWDVIAADLPGHGFTTSPAGSNTLPGMAQAVAALLDAIDAQPDCIVGHSAGAAIAIQMALDGLARPRLLIGLNAALMPFKGPASTVFPLIAKTIALNPATPWLFSGLAGWRFQTRRLIATTGSQLDPEGLDLYAKLFGRPSHVAGALTMMASWELEPMLARLPQLSVPTHLLTGTNDRTIDPREAKDLAGLHPLVTHQEIRGFGHLMHEEAPDQIAHHISQWAEVPGESVLGA
ncbi:MAG: alpha/beta fold hydrolase BchO [Pseudomonadota bacterium]